MRSSFLVLIFGSAAVLALPAEQTITKTVTDTVDVTVTKTVALGPSATSAATSIASTPSLGLISATFAAAANSTRSSRSRKASHTIASSISKSAAVSTSAVLSTSVALSISAVPSTPAVTISSSAASDTLPPVAPSSSAANAPTATGACHVTQYSDVAAAVTSCKTITLDGIAVPGGSTLDLTKLQTGSTVTFAGNTTFGFADSDYDMIKASGSGVTITAAPGAIIDGNGQAWWDGQGSNGGATKPDHFFVVSKLVGNSRITGLTIQNWPTHCFSISGADGLTIDNLVLDNSAGDAPNAKSSGLPAAHNSDGFDLSSSTNVVLSNTRVRNQDDCVAVTSGDNITVTGFFCDGGHGLSIGSVGGKSDNNVTNILFTNSQIVNSQNGARIKSNSNTTGSIEGITYSNIAVSNISTYGIDIQQDYLNGGPTGNPTNGVIIKDITITNVTGTASKNARDYYILCGDGSCSDFVFNDISITGGSKASSCNFATTGDFTCS